MLNKQYFTTKKLTQTALMAALLIVGKYSLNFVPYNIEIVTLLTLTFSFSLGVSTIFASLVFCAADILLYPTSPDVIISYFIYWPLMSLLTVLFKRAGIKNEISYLVLALIMTLLFGFLTTAMFCLFFEVEFWVKYFAGLYFYAIHLLSTLASMLLLFKPLTKILDGYA